MKAGEDMRDMVQLHITDSLPVNVRALPYADRVEVRFGKAFPAALIVDRPALGRLLQALRQGQEELDGAAPEQGEAVPQ